MTKNCSHYQTDVIEKQETYLVKNEEITIIAKVRKCENCNRELFDTELDTENLKQAYRKYKKNHNLMQSEEIIALRKKFHLTQNMLALLVGCTQATIARYENGSIQNNAHNTALSLLQNPNNVKATFETKKAEFTPAECNTLTKCLTDSHTLLIQLLENLYSYPPSTYSGFKKFDFDKFMATVLFFALNQPKLYKTKLMKLLWYSDMLFFKKNVTSITGMQYIHQKYGPVPINHLLCLGFIENLGIIELQEQDYGEIILPKANESLLRKLSNDELETLKIVNIKFLHTKAKDISAISHKEKGYLNTDLMEPISYEYAFDMN